MWRNLRTTCVWRPKYFLSFLSSHLSAPRVSSRIATLPSTHSRLKQRCTNCSPIFCRHLTTEASQEGNGEFELVYTGPLKGAVKALKIFSLSTAVLAASGGPVLVWLGNESVPVAARVALCSLVLAVGLSTTALLHWLLKGYITHLYYRPQTQHVAAHTLSLLARRVRNEFQVSDIRPPTGLSSFSTFQVQEKAYFMHTEVFPDKHLLTTLLTSQKNTKD